MEDSRPRHFLLKTIRPKKAGNEENEALFTLGKCVKQKKKKNQIC